MDRKERIEKYCRENPVVFYCSVEELTEEEIKEFNSKRKYVKIVVRR